MVETGEFESPSAAYETAVLDLVKLCPFFIKWDWGELNPRPMILEIITLNR